MALKVSAPLIRGAAPRLWWLAAVVTLAVCAVVVATAVGRQGLPALMRDPGAFVRWGYGVATTVQNIAVASTIGALIFAAFVVPPAKQGTRKRNPVAALTATGEEHPAFTRVMILATASSLLWTFSALAVLIFSFANIAGVPLSASSDFVSKLASYVTDIPTGTAWLWVVIIAALVSTLTFGVRSGAALAGTAGLALVGLVPMILIGHAAGGSDHEQAVNSLGLHLLGVTLWFGGLLALMVAGSALGKDTARVVMRYSTVAGFAFVIVVASGIINALIRIDVPAGLASAYGVILLLKTAATVFLGFVGFLHRKWIIPALASSKNQGRTQPLFWRLVLVELLIMGVVSGLAAGLSRTPPPGGEDISPALSPAEVLTGYLLPPDLTVGTWITVWRPDWLWIAVAIAAAYLYLRAIRVHRLRGGSWSWARSLSWLAGLGMLVFFTSGGPAVYGRVLFSAHVLDHLALTMIVPVLLVLGSPLTLALRALEPRTDGSMGSHEWIATVTQSRAWTRATHPAVASAVMVGSLVFFYYSDALGFALRQLAGRELMNAYFVAVGCLFVQSMLGTRPNPRPMASYRARVVLLVAVMATQGVMGAVLGYSRTLREPEWFQGLGRTWGLAPLADQQAAGVIQWVISAGAVLTIILLISIQTSRSDPGKERKNNSDHAPREPHAGPHMRKKSHAPQ